MCKCSIHSRIQTIAYASAHSIYIEIRLFSVHETKKIRAKESSNIEEARKLRETGRQFGAHNLRHYGMPSESINMVTTRAYFGIEMFAFCGAEEV